MKKRIPLLLKIGVWLGLNLLLLMGVGLGSFGLLGGVSGWLAGPVGDRLQSAANAITLELKTTPRDERNAMVNRHADKYGLEFGIYYIGGEFGAGTEFDLPREIAVLIGPPSEGGSRLDEFGRDNRPPPAHRRDDQDGLAPPPRNEAEGRRPPPPGVNRPPSGDGPRSDRPIDRDRPEGRPSLGPDALGGRFFEHAGDPPRWWAAVRIPVATDSSTGQRPGVLIAVSDSSLAFGTLLDVKPMIWAVVISLLVSVIWWIPLVLGITRAMVKMVRATESIAEGRFETRVGVSRSDEIGRLGESIDQMAERLDSLVNGQRKFLGDVAHELGSPIGRLQLGTSILEERVPDKLRPAVADVREEVQEMSVLVGELLAFTKAEMRTAETELGVVNLSELVEKAIKREASERSVSVDVDSHLEVIADPALLLRSVGNVVRNAVRYAGENATLRVDARSLSTGRVRLTVSDSGPGVPDAALGRLGEPFFRPDLARTREMGGVGLGLSIVKSAVKSMGGTVKFSNADPQGFVVTFELASA